LFFILVASLIDSLVALVGIFSLWMSDESLKKILIVLVAFSAGALLSGALFHLTEESLINLDSMEVFMLIIVGFISFFIIEKFIHWHHCHEGKCDKHPFTYLILVGDAVHNFVDGLVIAASFFVSLIFGWITTMLVILHEIPQELGDFGTLVYGGFEKKKALFFNFLSQITCVIGALTGFFLTGFSNTFIYLLPFAAGGFIYIASSDLIPELRKEQSVKKSLVSFLFFVIGVLFILIMRLAFPD